MLQATLHFFSNLWTCDVINKHFDPWFERVCACHKFTNRRRTPHKAALLGVINFSIGCVIESICAQMELRGKRLKRYRFDRLGLSGPGSFVLTKSETIQFTHKFTFYSHFTSVVYFGHNGFLLSQSAQKHGCAPIYKSLGQTLVQRIRQPVFYRTRLVAPMTFVTCPPFALCHISPRPYKSEPFGQCINVPVHAINALNLTCHIVIRDATALVQVVKNNANKVRMFTITDAPKVRQTTGVPQQFDGWAITCTCANFRHFRQGFKCC